MYLSIPFDVLSFYRYERIEQDIALHINDEPTPTIQEDIQMHSPEKICHGGLSISVDVSRQSPMPETEKAFHARDNLLY